jgi:hypothetical protein
MPLRPRAIGSPRGGPEARGVEKNEMMKMKAAFGSLVLTALLIGTSGTARSR